MPQPELSKHNAPDRDGTRSSSQSKSNKDKNVGGDKGDKNKVKSMNDSMINWIYCDDCGDRIDYENTGFKEEFADYEAKSVMRDGTSKHMTPDRDGTRSSSQSKSNKDKNVKGPLKAEHTR